MIMNLLRNVKLRFIFIFCVSMALGLPLSIAQFYNLGAFWKTQSTSTIYRSVGPNNAGALAIGTSNAVTISGSQATFASALPLNVGVGDAIQYQITGTWYLAFVSGRTSSTVYTLQNVSGGKPTSTVGSTNWSIYRAYTSLANAVDATAGGTENTSINPAIRNFDSWTGGANLVAGNQQWNVALYADGVDSTPVDLSAWTTGSTLGTANYLKIYTPFLTTEVGTSQRHPGYWSTSAYNLQVNGVTAIHPGSVNVVIDGIQILCTNRPTNGGCIGQNWNGPIITVKNSIIQGAGSASTNTGGIYFTNQNSTFRGFFYNNIIYNFSGIFEWGIGVEDGGASGGEVTYAYNNTLVNNALMTRGWNGNVLTMYAKNNIVQGWNGNNLNFNKEPGDIWGSGTDYNLSSDGTSTGGAHDLTNTAVVFANPAINDFRISTSDISAKGAGFNLSADSYLPFSSDIQSITRSLPWDIGASTPVAGTSYRSVGPGNTSALAIGTSNAMTIAGTSASFAINLPGNVGVGDAIQYNVSGTWYLAFFVARNSSHQFSVLTATRGIPTGASSNTTWSVFRAYTSLAGAIAGHGSENIGINASVRGFETFSGGSNNLVTSKSNWVISCYADAVDTTAVDTVGWVSGPANTLRIYAPNLPTDVGATQRHNGSWASGAYTLSVTTNRPLQIQTDNVSIDGLQIQITNMSSNKQVVNLANISAAGKIYFHHNIIRTSGNSWGSGCDIFTSQATVNAAASVFAYDNITFPDATMSDGNGLDCYNVSGGINYIYNNTCNNGYAGGGASIGIQRNGGVVLAKNNLMQGAASGDYVGTFLAGSDYNLSKDATTTGGSHDIHNATVTFNNTAVYDYRLSPLDVAAKGAAEILSNDLSLRVTDDITMATRTSPWDIGASMPASIIWLQKAENTSTAGNNYVVNNPMTNVNNGDLIVCQMYFNTGWDSVTSLTDDQGNYYYPTFGPRCGGGSLSGWCHEIWYAQNVVGGSSLTTTAYFNGGQASESISCHEYCGAATQNPLDTYAVTTNTSANPSSGAAATSFARELIFGADMVGAGSSSAGAGFTSRSTYNNDTVEDKVVQSTGSYSADFTAASTDWIAQMATFTTTNSPSCGPIKVVQDVPGISGAYENNALTSSQAMTNTAGNLLVVYAYAGQGPTAFPASTTPNMVFTVTDTLGNTYYPGPFVNDTTCNNASLQIFYAPNIIGGSNTITVTQSNLPLGTNPTTGMFVSEYSGLALTNVVDVSSIYDEPPGYYGPMQVSNMTTTTSCDLVVAAYSAGCNGSQQSYSSPGWRMSNSDLGDPAGALDNLPKGATAGSVVNAYFGQWMYTGWTTAQMAFRASGTSAPAQPTKIAFTTGPQTVNTYTCNAVTVQSQNVSSVATNTSVGIPLTVSGAGATYYADPGCLYPVSSSLLIGAGMNSQTFYFMATTAGSPTITVAASGFTSINQTETMNNSNPFLWIGGAGCSGNWNLGGTANVCWKGGFDPGASNVAQFDGTCTINCSPTLTADITVGGIWMHSSYAGTITQGTHAVTVNNNLQQDAGTYTVTSGALTVLASMNLTGGVFNAGSSTITPLNFNASTGTPTVNTQTSTFVMPNKSYFEPGSVVFNNVTATQLAWYNTVIYGTLNVMGTLYLNCAAYSGISGGTINATGPVILNATTGGGSTEIIFSGTTAQTFTSAGGTLPGGTVTIAKTGGGTLTLNNDMILTSYQQSFVVSSGVLNLNGHNLTVAQDFSNAGTVNAGASTISVGGNWTNTGTFNSGTSTVAFTGNPTLSGVSSFFNFSYASQGGKYIIFPAGLTTTVTGALNLSGTSAASQLSVQSSTSTVQAKLNATGTNTTSYLNVIDSNAITPIAIGGAAGSSANSGDNTGWTFP